MVSIPWSEHHKRQQAEQRELWKNSASLDPARWREEIQRFAAEHFPALVGSVFQLPGMLADELLRQATRGEAGLVFVIEGTVESQAPRWRPFAAKNRALSACVERLRSESDARSWPPHFTIELRGVRFGKDGNDMNPALGILASVLSPQMVPHRAFIPVTWSGL